MNNNRKYAALDNQVQNFLVKFCEEDPSYSQKANELYVFYQNHHAECTVRPITGRYYCDYGRKWMSRGSFDSRLLRAGFLFHRAIERGLKGNDTKVVYAVGVRLKQARQNVVTIADKAARVVSSSDLVAVGNQWFDRALITSVRAIKSFTHFQTNEVITHIVTFKNPEIGHKFISADSAALLMEDLGLNLPNFRQNSAL
jgi:hypothetical protein